jgi:CelD/BcsL family acetyltransferase involved in cellulose biosynthesis
LSDLQQGDRVNVIEVDPRTDRLWLTLVEQHECSVFASPGWLSVLSDSYGWQAQARVLVDAAGEPQAGVPFYRIVDIIGERIVTLPFSDYCDPIVSDIDRWRRLVDPLLGENCPVAIRCVHNDVPLLDERLSVTKRAKWHGFDLGRDIDAIWRGLDEAAQRAIRKSERDGLEVRIASTPEDLRAFFEMHLGLRKYKYQMLAQPFRFFENIWRAFLEPGHGFLLLALFQGKAIGGVLFLIWKDTLYYKFNASAPSDLAHRPNDRLIWEGIELGKSRGCRHFDFGLSDWDQEGLLRYKRKFGSTEKTISFLRYKPHGAAAEQEKFGRDLLAGVTALFVDRAVPDPVTERAGQDLYRYFT